MGILHGGYYKDFFIFCIWNWPVGSLMATNHLYHLSHHTFPCPKAISYILQQELPHQPASLLSLEQ